MQSGPEENNQDGQQTYSLSLPSRYQPRSARNGGLGVVIFCHDQIDDRPVVLKTYRPEKITNRNARIRFLEEATNWIFLGSHPNIVTAYRAERMGNPLQPFVVMEAITGKGGFFEASLVDILKKRRSKPVAVEFALKLALDVVRGMQFATGSIEGLIHRDLKPGNILVDEHGVAKVTDFGLACAFTEEQKQQMGLLKGRVKDENYHPAGSLPYIAPEAWSPANVVDCRADIYALGVTLVQMVTGALPTPKEAKLAREIHLSGSLPQLDISIDERVRDFIGRCTALNENERYPTWAATEEALIDLYEALLGEKAPPAGVGEPPQNRKVNAGSYIALGASFLELGAPDSAEVYLTRALEIAREIDAAALEMKAGLSMVNTLAYRGESERALDLLSPFLDGIDKTEPSSQSGELLALAGNLYARLGRFDQAFLFIDQAMALAEKTDNGPEITHLLGVAANIYAEKKEFVAAIMRYQLQLKRLDPEIDPLNTSICLSNLGAAYLDARQASKAPQYLLRAAELSASMGDVNGQIQATKLLCEAYRVLDDRNSLDESMAKYRRLCSIFNIKEES